jgi:hypothetical protein
MSNVPIIDCESKPAAPSRISPRTARILAPILLILGVQCWLLLGEGNYGHQYKPLIILLSILAGLIPPFARALNRLWNAIAQPSPAARRWIVVCIWIASSLFLYWSQWVEQTPFKPKFQDEFSYLTQMRMLAHGRLWMPPLPLPDYFDNLYLLVRPVYASMYFPGAAMMFVPALLLHLPYYVGALAVAGLCAALLWLVFAELLDGASAFLAVFLLHALPMFRMLSIMPMAQIPALLLGLVMTWSVLQWRKQFKPRWLLLLGFAAGWGAITRPADALCFVFVFAVVMAMDLKTKPASTWLRTVVLVTIPVVPFLLFQLFLNQNITGQWFTTPFARYNDALYPGAFGFHSTAPPDHVSNFPDVQLFYEGNAKGVIAQHQLKNLFPIILHGEWDMARRVAVAEPFLWLIMPLSLPVMWNRGLFVIWGMLPVFLIGLSAYAFSYILPHYMVMVMPTMILFALLPIRFLTDTFPSQTAAIRTMIALSITAFAIAALPGVNRVAHDQYFETPELEQVDHVLAHDVSPPAVVLFHFNPGQRVNLSENPIYNAEVPWPDDAPVIRARDLNPDISSVAKPGDLDRPLYEYYSGIAPTRVFYVYNRGGGANQLKCLGTASQLLALTAPTSRP